MTENEVKSIKWMKCVRDDAVVTLDNIAKNEPNVSPMLYAGRKEKAETIIKGFEELEQYRSIGTVEECRAAAKKQKAIKPTFEMNFGDFESRFSCECGKKIVVRHDRGVMDNHDGPNYCSNCGKKWDWGDIT